MLVMTLCGCSSFNRAWKKAAKSVPVSEPFEGRWEGHWRSDKNGHNGKLRCIITEKNGIYPAQFRATYMKIFRFSYTVPLEVSRTNDIWYFHSEADLGALAGGVYQYEGMATSNRFYSTYTSKYDHGYFEMSRPE